MKKLLQKYLPHILISKFFGILANSKWKFVKNTYIKIFMKNFNIDMRDYIEEDPYGYATFNDFFTRDLKPQARNIDQDPNKLVSPCDGTVLEFGHVTNNTLLQAKGSSYSLRNLFANYDAIANDFSNGSYATVYLAPFNYHKIHSVSDVILTNMIYVPGKLYSVSPWTVANISNVYTKNERMIGVFESPKGKIAVVFVGAMIVGGIAASWCGTVNSRRDNKVIYRRYPNNDDYHLFYGKGDEIGKFLVGSTAIVLTERKISFEKHIESDTSILMGESIGSF